MPEPPNPTLVDVITAALASERASMWTSAPAVVQSFDATKQRADLIITSTRPIFDDDDEIKAYETLPILPAVPVLMFGGSTARLELPLVPGDGGLVIFSSLDMAAWLATGTVPSNPSDPARNVLGSGVFFPGVVPLQAPSSLGSGATVLTGEDVRLGAFTATQRVALQNLVRDAIQVFLTPLCNAPVTPADGGAALQLAIKSAVQAAWGGTTTVPDLGAQKVKAE